MHVPPPSPRKQLAFMDQVQRLFEEGEFVATYKFALLLAITELAVEKGRDSGEAFELSFTELADKFLELYWPQAIPYAGGSQGGVLVQNNGRQAATVVLLHEIRARHGTLAKARASNEWPGAVRRTVALLKEMPLWRLQILRRQQVDFLYVPGSGSSIALLPGVMYNLRRFQGLIRQLIQFAWINHIRNNPKNAEFLGDGADLEQVLFGSDRVSLALARPVLRELQHDNCFYCRTPLRNTGEVDHFIPWARYPRDLGHNFVLAHKACNGDKRDLLASAGHLEAWVNRNISQGGLLTRELSGQFICHEDKMLRVAQWSYSQAYQTSSQSWLAIKTVVPLAADCLRILHIDGAAVTERHQVSMAS